MVEIRRTTVTPLDLLRRVADSGVVHYRDGQFPEVEVMLDALTWAAIRTWRKDDEGQEGGTADDDG